MMKRDQLEPQARAELVRGEWQDMDRKPLRRPKVKDAT
jgi:hypothetical protein